MPLSMMLSAVTCCFTTGKIRREQMRVLTLLNCPDNAPPLRALRRNEYDLFMAGSFTEALDYLNKMPFDLVLCQDNFANYEMAIAEALRLIRTNKCQSDVPVICCHMDNDPIDERYQKRVSDLLLQYGGQGYLDNRACTPRHFANSIANCMRRAVGGICITKAV